MIRPDLVYVTPLLLVTAALAADGFTDAGVLAGVIQRLDADGDGQIGASEYASFECGQPFTDLDSDLDGLVTVDELGLWLRRTPPKPDLPQAEALQPFFDGVTGAPAGFGAPSVPGVAVTPSAAPGRSAGESAKPRPIVSLPGAPVAVKADSPGRSDIPDDPEKIQLHLIDFGHLGKGQPFKVTVNSGEPFMVADDGKGIDRTADDGAYAFLTKREESPELEMTVKNDAGTWAGKVFVARATAIRPVPIEMGANGALSVVAARDGPGRPGPGSQAGSGRPPGSGARPSGASGFTPSAGPSGAAGGGPWLKNIVVPIFAACLVAFGLGAALARWRR